MCKCRYYGKCAGNCDSRGLVLGFGNETYDCDDFQPMPDVDALMKLADEMDGLGLTGFSSGWSSGAVNVGSFARRIREAVRGHALLSRHGSYA